MSEFDSGKKKRAAGEAREFVAKFYAMPLRTITEVETAVEAPVRTEVYRRTPGRIVVLECGHRGVLSLWLRVGESMRCRDCYEGGLQAAERMIERIGG